MAAAAQGDIGEEKGFGEEHDFGAADPEPSYTPTPAGLVDLPSFDPPAASASLNGVSEGAYGLGRVRDIPLEVTVELGRTRLLIRDIMDLSPGSIIELDKIAGEPVDLFANGLLVARGEVIVIDDNFGVRVTEIITAAERKGDDKESMRLLRKPAQSQEAPPPTPINPQFWGVEEPIRRTSPPPSRSGGGRRSFLFRFPQYWGLGGLCLLALSCASVCADPPKPAAPPAKTPAPTAKLSAPVPKAPMPVPKAPVPPAPVPAVIPDYGGRDSAPLTVGDSAPNPLGQAGRALEALLIVLVGVVGVVYGLKRFGLVTPGADGKPARITLPTGRGQSLPSASVSAAGSPVTVVSSQTLPGGAMLHVVSVAGRTLLLAATSQTVTTVAEWPTEPEPAERTVAFEDYLARADAAPESALAAANARLRSLLSGPPREEP